MGPMGTNFSESSPEEWTASQKTVGPVDLSVYFCGSMFLGGEGLEKGGVLNIIAGMWIPVITPWNVRG